MVPIAAISLTLGTKLSSSDHSSALKTTLHSLNSFTWGVFLPFFKKSNRDRVKESERNGIQLCPIPLRIPSATETVRSTHRSIHKRQMCALCNCLHFHSSPPNLETCEHEFASENKVPIFSHARHGAIHQVWWRSKLPYKAGRLIWFNFAR